MSSQHRKVYESVNGRKLLQMSGGGQVKVNNMVIVNKDGSLNFTTISDAMAVAPNNTAANKGYFMIYVVGGVYEEYVSIAKNKQYLMIVGDGINLTIITGNHSGADGWTAYSSETVGVALWMELFPSLSLPPLNCILQVSPSPLSPLIIIIFPLIMRVQKKNPRACVGGLRSSQEQSLLGLPSSAGWVTDFPFTEHTSFTPSTVSGSSISTNALSRGETFSCVSPEFQNELLYNNLVIACLDKGMIRLSLASMKKMRELGHPISHLIFNSLIILHSLPNRRKAITRILRQMRADKVDPHVSTYNILMKIEANQHNIDGLVTVFGDMKRAQVKPKEIFFCILATAHAVARLYTICEAYVEAVEKSATGNNWSTLDVLILYDIWERRR
ncbi:Pentatricopeptide repeat-containing protein [Camellia lanceoleosa]|uniref:Pentatricopeptide repeat-containing protein n=1 Tax=Camellia lanceoleosa TaxID=1840588 RepID=A0ACC0IPQ7_9ERIC|nr:Pentatricopeptide repeat-containing protein [Camellia lanceoleosa]